MLLIHSCPLNPDLVLNLRLLEEGGLLPRDVGLQLLQLTLFKGKNELKAIMHKIFIYCVLHDNRGTHIIVCLNICD